VLLLLLLLVVWLITPHRVHMLRGRHCSSLAHSRTQRAARPAFLEHTPTQPGTSERVLLLSGTLHSVLTSVFLMLEKLPKDPIMAMGRAAAKPREDVVRVAINERNTCVGSRVGLTKQCVGLQCVLTAHPDSTHPPACPSTPHPATVSPQVKMAVSRKLCGAVIGQKGQTIRDFMLDSGATIRVQVCVTDCVCVTV
jgi:hypothetical protein